MHCQRGEVRHALSDELQGLTCTGSGMAGPFLQSQDPDDGAFDNAFESAFASSSEEESDEQEALNVGSEAGIGVCEE